MTAFPMPPGARLRGRVEAMVLDSDALRGNPLGDPSRREVFVYLPPSYDGSRRFPVVMLLGPYGSDNRVFVQGRMWEPTTFERFDRLLAEGACDEAILVAPDGCTRWGGSQFLDAPAVGRYQTHLVDEVLPLVDARHRTIPRPEARAIVGRSSGGFGALRVALDRPGVFGAVGSHAGDGLFEVSLRPLFTPAAVALDRAGGLGAFLARVEAGGPREPGEFEALMMVASAAAYAPDRGSPFSEADLPFDRWGVPRPDVWAHVLEHDPVRRLEADPGAMRGLSTVYLDAGAGDEHGLQFAARRVAELLRARGAMVRHEEFPGGHRGTAGRYAVSLPHLVGALCRV